jgi:predicted ester cyclase
MSVSPEQLKAQTERLIEEVLNNRNLSLIEEFIAPEYILQGSQPPVQGPDGYRRFIEGVLISFPDIHFTLEDLFITGDKIALRWSMQGTQQGVWLGLPPSGKAVTDSGINFQRVNEEGKLVEEWIRNDGLGILIQLGVFQISNPAPAPASS